MSTDYCQSVISFRGNASAAEETANSVQELNSTISTLAASAGSLQNLSEELQKSVEIFKL